jgi:hypothetical protein
MARGHVENRKQYEALKKKGMSKSRAAAIANSPGASKRGGKSSGTKKKARRPLDPLQAGRDECAEEGGRPARRACTVEEALLTSKPNGGPCQSVVPRREGELPGRRRGAAGVVGQDEI